MTATFMGVSIDPTTIKDGSLKGAFDPITHPQTRGFGVTVVAGTAKSGSTALGPVITSAVQAATGGTLAPASYDYSVAAVGQLGEGRRGATSTAVVAAALAAPVQAAIVQAAADGGVWGTAAATYFYKVTAINALGETVGSNEQSGATTATTDSLTVSWAAVTGATGYKVYRGTGAGLEDHLVGTVGLVTSFKDVGNTGTAASVPVANTTATTTNKVTLTWASIPGETGGYKVYRGAVHLANVGHGVLTYVDNGGVAPSGAAPTTGFAEVTVEGELSPKPVDGGESPVEGEGDTASPTQAAL